MSVKVMKVKTAADVVGSKNLRVYTFEAPAMDDLTVVANLTNVYFENDLVGVAMIGTILPDGLEIVKRKVFGIESCGMAIGKVNGTVGTVLSDDEVVNLLS